MWLLFFDDWCRARAKPNPFPQCLRLAVDRSRGLDGLWDPCSSFFGLWFPCMHAACRPVSRTFLVYSGPLVSPFLFIWVRVNLFCSWCGSSITSFVVNGACLFLPCTVFVTCPVYVVLGFLLTICLCFRFLVAICFLDFTCLFLGKCTYCFCALDACTSSIFPGTSWLLIVAFLALVFVCVRLLAEFPLLRLFAGP